jgi:hypothetical protein
VVGEEHREEIADPPAELPAGLVDRGLLVAHEDAIERTGQWAQ